jgi:hypothetical protein
VQLQVDDTQAGPLAAFALVNGRMARMMQPGERPMAV